MVENWKYPGTHALRDPNKPAVIIAGSGESITYGELHDGACRLARFFVDAGLKPGDSVAICLRNGVDYPLVHWAATYAGLHSVLLSFHLRSPEVAYILKDSAAKMLIIGSTIFDEIGDELHQAVPHVPRYLVGDSRPGLPNLREVAAGFPAELLDDPVQGQDLLYSSGTTGVPKGIQPSDVQVPLGFGSPLVDMQQIAYGADETTVYLTPAPYYHAAPSGSVKAMLSLGATVVLMEKFDPEIALRAIEEHQVTHSQWVPTMFVRMLALPEEVRESVDLSSLKVAVHAAAPCPVPLKTQMFAWWGPIIHEYYGGSEGAGMTYCSPEDWLERPGTVGRAMWGELHILDDAFNELAPEEVGGIYFSGFNEVTYRNDPAKSAAARSPQGWSTIGDVGYVDGDGFLFLTDRQSDMIISGGVNVYPREVENAFLLHPDVSEVAVFGVPDGDLGETVRAAVVLRAGVHAGDAVETALINHLREHLAGPKRPKSIQFRAELPALPTGKILKRALRDEYAAPVPVN